MRTVLACLFCLVIVPVVAFAQEPLKNPQIVQFTPVDYQLVDRFEGGYFLVAVTPTGGCDATVVPLQPIQLEDLQKPGLLPSNDVQQVLKSRPVFGCFVYKVRAWGGVFVSPWSDPSNDFQLTPLQQGRPTIR